MANTFWMLFCLPIAYAVSVLEIRWFFPAMLLIIGGRYLTFGVLYGTKLYWFLGIALAAAGWLLVMLGASATAGAFAGSAIEFCFATALFVAASREHSE